LYGLSNQSRIRTQQWIEDVNVTAAWPSDTKWQQIKPFMAFSYQCHNMGALLPVSTRPYTQDAVRPQAKSVVHTQTIESIDVCLPSQIGNGVCDEACNHAGSEFDGGDCCKRKDSHSPTGYHCRNGPVVLMLHGASWNYIDSSDLLLQFSDIGNMSFLPYVLCVV
jgi:hypothetical protein